MGDPLELTFSFVGGRPCHVFVQVWEESKLVRTFSVYCLEDKGSWITRCYFES